ncbi:MAG: hypothetical protein R3228_08755 [Halioglobus sp.]|nr:hypothetical protein [Halioglobus sp.]
MVTLPGDEDPLFLVSVSTHHADLHNGYSRVRFQEVLAANKFHHIDTPFSLNLLHYSAWSYHPDFLMASSRNEGRLGPMPALEPKAWDDILGAAQSLPITGAGPTYARMVEHVRLFPSHYLPALDRAGVAPRKDALARLESLLAHATALAGLQGELSDSDRKTALHLQSKVAQYLADARQQLSLTGEQRIAVRRFKEVTAGPRPMMEALLREPGLESIANYLAALDRAAESAEPLAEPSWQGKFVDVRFSYTRGRHYGLKTSDYDEKLPCYEGSVQFDGRHLAAGVDLGLRASVPGNYCRHPDGDWHLYSRWAK